MRQEIGLAWKYGKPYLPLLLDTTPFPKEIEYFLEMSQWIEVLDHPAESWLPKVRAALARPGAAASPIWEPQPTAPDPIPASGESRPENLPTPLTALIGRRQADLARVVELMHAGRLVTLTGPVGSARRVWRSRRRTRWPEAFRMASPSSRWPRWLIRRWSCRASRRHWTCAGPGDEPQLATLMRAIGTRRVLLVLDNLEQADRRGARDRAACSCNAPDCMCSLPAASRCASPASANTRCSRCCCPTRVTAPTRDALLANESVRPFVERAQSVRAGFALTTDNAEAVATICRRLDGLPLAIELAAARCKVLMPAAILTRLAQPLDVLTGGARDLPERQQTMRGAVQWSFHLLHPPSSSSSIAWPASSPAVGLLTPRKPSSLTVSKSMCWMDCRRWSRRAS